MKKSELTLTQQGSGEPPDELLKNDNLKHKDRRVIALIKPQIWDKAKWRATLYLVAPDSDFPPCIALGFKNKDAGKRIFDDFTKKIGRGDKNNEIRLSIITGIDIKRPSSYFVVVSPNPKTNFDESDITQLVMISRYNQMDPNSTQNLDRFLKKYKVPKEFTIYMNYVKNLKF